MNKEKDVFITIKSVQTADDETKDTTELFTVGSMTIDDESRLAVRYDESEATGFKGSSVTLNVYSDDKISLIRKGTANSDLIMEKGKKHHCHYGTEYGGFMVGISTDEIRNNLSENGGDLYFRYTVDINSGFISVNELFINIKEHE